ncbi:MAG TPA: SDR family oxidoreductase [Anaerolineae bacterium]|nr:SDR family oxidoreductase [Anaerolineae bacterium]HPL29710.1 SDR family oxidoreductase [Anaerolineae bacterium]
MAYVIDLSGKTAIVTGAAKGIGAATARILAEAGAQVVIDDLVPQEAIETLLSEIEAVGLRPDYLREDISDPQQAQRLIQQTAERFGSVDILINNAGVVADWDKSFDVHVKGAYYCAEAAKEIMAANGGGRMVNVTSTCSQSGGTGIPQYVATKGGLFSLTRYLARTYAPLGILVNGVMPAVIMSDMIMTRYESEAEMLEHYIPMMPIRRIGYPIDVARIILFLCSELSGFICGEIITADGGRMHVGI